MRSIRPFFSVRKTPSSTVSMADIFPAARFFDSFRLLCRVEKIAPLTDGFRVENRKIGAEALLQQAPIF